MKIYTLKLNKNQIVSIMKNLELISRIHMGQFSEIRTIIGNDKLSYEKSIKIESILKEMFYPGLDGHYSIRSENINDDARIAWDISKTIRHAISWDESPEGGDGVNFDNPDLTSGQERPVVSIINTEKKKICCVCGGPGIHQGTDGEYRCDGNDCVPF